MAKDKKKLARAAALAAKVAALKKFETTPDPLDPEPDEPDDDEPDEMDDDRPERGKPFGTKFSQWRDNLADDVSNISIYVYKLEARPNGIPKKIQAYQFTIPRDAEPPETHDIGCIVGSGDFDIVARARGNEIMRKQIAFGPVYDDLKAEQRERKTQPVQVQAAPVQVQAADPFAALAGIFKSIQPLLTPLVGAFAAALNPMENIRRMNSMGEEMAQKSFDFKMKVGAEAARVANERDDDDDAPPVPGISAATRSGWEDKLSDLADLLVWKGREYLQATGDKAQKMGDTVKRKVLNDAAFQTLLQNPAEFKTAYAKLCKDCAEIGGAKTVGAILQKLGIQPPVILGTKPAAAKAKAAA